MTNATSEVTEAIERGKREILEDIRNERVPADVATFSALHDHVDANEYGGLCEGWAMNRADYIAVGNVVQNALDAWIRSGGIKEKMTPAGEGTKLVITFDVAGLTEYEIDAVCGEAIVQGEASDHHPDVPATSQIVQP